MTKMSWKPQRLDDRKRHFVKRNERNDSREVPSILTTHVTTVEKENYLKPKDNFEMALEECEKGLESALESLESAHEALEKIRGLMT